MHSPCYHCCAPCGFRGHRWRITGTSGFKQPELPTRSRGLSQLVHGEWFFPWGVGLEDSPFFSRLTFLALIYYKIFWDSSVSYRLPWCEGISCSHLRSESSRSTGMVLESSATTRCYHSNTCTSNDAFLKATDYIGLEVILGVNRYLQKNLQIRRDSEATTQQYQMRT